MADKRPEVGRTASDNNGFGGRTAVVVKFKYKSMKLTLRGLLLVAVVTLTAGAALAQTTKWKDIHKVKRKETIFGIARDNGITVEELKKANPEMNNPDYKLKKGDMVFIPYPSKSATATAQTPTAVKDAPKAKDENGRTDMRKREIRVGVMLPLHDINGDGRRMVEYYRGVLMACDSLRQNGISVDIRAWNVPEEADIRTTLKDKHAAQCDLIIGPLYSKQVKPLSDFATKHGIKVLIPFSINTPETALNRNIYQVYQNHNDCNESVIGNFIERFAGYNTIIVDCNDTTSKKGVFTFGLRRRMESMGRNYTITNLKQSEAAFAKAFSATMPNVVVLNTARSPELNVAFAKLNGLLTSNPKLKISLFGYTEWMMYTKYNLDNYYKFDTYIPGTFYMNPASPRTARFEQKYRWNFHADMMPSLPRFAMTGFDHAYYFIKGLHMYGDLFVGPKGVVGYVPFQTPLHFERIGNGGLQNRGQLFVHYTPEHRIETINF